MKFSTQSRIGARNYHKVRTSFPGGGYSLSSNIAEIRFTFEDCVPTSEGRSHTDVFLRGIFLPERRTSEKRVTRRMSAIFRIITPFGAAGKLSIGIGRQYERIGFGGYYGGKFHPPRDAHRLRRSVIGAARRPVPRQRKAGPHWARPVAKGRTGPADGTAAADGRGACRAAGTTPVLITRP